VVKELEEVIAYIQDLLENKTSFDEAWDASYDLPHFISKRIDAIMEYNLPAMRLLNDNVLDLCAALDSSGEEDWPYVITEKTFRKKLAEVLVKLKKL
jgi:hypothetical protein